MLNIMLGKAVCENGSVSLSLSSGVVRKDGKGSNRLMD